MVFCGKGDAERSRFLEVHIEIDPIGWRLAEEILFHLLCTFSDYEMRIHTHVDVFGVTETRNRERSVLSLS